VAHWVLGGMKVQLEKPVSHGDSHLMRSGMQIYIKVRRYLMLVLCMLSHSGLIVILSRVSRKRLHSVNSMPGERTVSAFTLITPSARSLMGLLQMTTRTRCNGYEGRDSSKLAL
jgi:hypothetical protein